MKNNNTNGKYSINTNINPYNVVFIQLDELSIKYLGAYGNKQIKTPNIDRLAADGVMFKNSYCATPYCSPTRASFVTGQWPSKNEIICNTNNLEGLVGTEIITEQIIYENGYVVEHFGKWHIGNKKVFECYENSEYTAFYTGKYNKPYTSEPAPDGYVLSGGTYVTQYIYDVFTKAVNEKVPHGALLKIGRQLKPIENDEWMGLANETVNFIETNKSNPFMVTMSLHPPHAPYHVPEPYYSMYNPDEIQLSDTFNFNNHSYHDEIPYTLGQLLGEKGIREYMRVIYGMVTMMDDAVGKVLDTLDKNNLTENTLVVFTSDHGQFNGNHGGMICKVVNAFYNEFTQVPLIIKLPKEIQASLKLKSYVNSVDIPVTILDYLNIQVPKSMQGRSLKPIISNGVDPENLGIAMCQQPGCRMIVNDKYKYNFYFGGGKLREELFSIVNDPNEIDNLANKPEYSEVKVQMKALLDENLAKIDDMSTQELLRTGGPIGNINRRLDGEPIWRHD